MSTDPQQIHVAVDAVLADLPALGPDPATDAGAGGLDFAAIDAVGRGLERAHQILVDALESVEKG